MRVMVVRWLIVLVMVSVISAVGFGGGYADDIALKMSDLKGDSWVKLEAGTENSSFGPIVKLMWRLS